MKIETISLIWYNKKWLQNRDFVERNKRMTNRTDWQTIINRRDNLEAFQYIAKHIEKQTKMGKTPCVFIKTYGCQMNEHDSERMEWIFYKLGYQMTEDEKNADVILYNTCLIRENAELKVLGRVGALKSLKENNPNLKIILCGCMMQREEIRTLIQEKYRQVDIVFGTNSIHELPNLLYKNLMTGKFSTDVLENKDLIVEDIESIRKFSFKAYVNIMYGCNNFCTYCVVPYTRGRELSRMPEDILKQIHSLAKEGTKEIILLGQNVNSYGKKFENGYRFHHLLKDIDKIEGIERIKFMTSHPRDISDELIDCYGSLKHLSPYIHLPVQSGSDKILREMNRHYTVSDYLASIQKLRKRVPDIAISTDIIVGFPGESEEDFSQTLNLVKEVQYDSCYSFIYSKRPGTKAAKMVNHVPDEVKSDRLNRLNELLNHFAFEKNQAYLNKEVIVLVEEPSKTDGSMLSGRTDSSKLVHFPGDPTTIGKFVRVKIERVKTFSLEGKLVEVMDS